MLPHDLATHLRTVILDTPSNVSEEDKKKQVEEENYELYYWENPETNNITPQITYCVAEGRIINDVIQRPIFDNEPSGGDGGHLNNNNVSGTQILPPSKIPIHSEPHLSNSLRGPAPYRPPLDSSSSHHGEQLRGTEPGPSLLPDPRQMRHGNGSQNIPGRRLSPDPRYDPRVESYHHNPRESYDDLQVEPYRHDPRSFKRDEVTAPFRTHMERDISKTVPYPNEPIPRSHIHHIPHSNIPPRSHSSPHSNLPLLSNPHSNIPPMSNPHSHSSPRSNLPPMSNTHSHSSPRSNLPPMSNPHSHSSLRATLPPFSNPHSRSNPYPNSNAQSNPHSNYSIPTNQQLHRQPPTDNITATSSQDRTINNNRSQPMTTIRASERLVDPRKKYSQFKIKPKSTIQDDSKLASDPSLPKLLRDSSVLDKPIAPNELFGSSPGGISLFGSRNQLSSESTDDNPEYGEIKMRRDSIQQQEETIIRNHSDDNEGETPVLPSYLTHLNLGISKDEVDNEIDSAFGSLQSRKRRLSELQSLSNTDTDHGLPDDMDTPTTTVTSNTSINSSKMFSFGSNLY